MNAIGFPGLCGRKTSHRPRLSPLARLPAIALRPRNARLALRPRHAVPAAFALRSPLPFGTGLPWRSWLAFFALLSWCARLAFRALWPCQARRTALPGQSSLTLWSPRACGAYRTVLSWRSSFAALALWPHGPRRAGRTRRTGGADGTVGAVPAWRAIAHFEEPALDRGNALDRLMPDFGDRRTSLGRHELAPPLPITIGASKNLGDGLTQRVNQSVAVLGQFRRAGF